MTEPDLEAMGEPPRTTELWIYGGLRLLDSKPVHAWIPVPDAGQPLPDELWYRPKTRGGWMVGGIYHATVTRTDERVQLYGAPGPWLRRHDDGEAIARLQILDRSTRDQIAHAALQRRAAKDSALGTAITPLLELAAGLRTDTDVRALLAYLTEQIYAARWRR